ncbi:MAG: hypothetical protein JO257_13685 [Deltaproteobacteria bacterium]|nr:hypothetical protein [Deltaproteobacteria bacterium]
MRAWVVLLAVAACAKSKSHQLSLDYIRVSADARLRTDTVGVGTFEEQATFVLVDADNTSKEGAYVTLGGKLADASGTELGQLRTQSLWIPAGETRTFALVDRERKPRPSSARARIEVKGALVPASPPPYRVANVAEHVDGDHVVTTGTVENDADIPGAITLIASFHDDGGRPMTRPFTLLKVAPHGKLPVQFAGPPNSKHGTIFCGDVIYPSPPEIPSELDPTQFGSAARMQQGLDQVFDHAQR